VLVGAAISIVSTGASAADAKFELGLRTGYALPFGKVFDENDGTAGDDVKEVVVGQVPLWLDVGARIGGQIFVGGYVQYGIGVLAGSLSDDCDAADRNAEAGGGSVSCSASDVRLGAQAHYHFGQAGASVDPWVGAGLGYEWISISETARGGGESLEISTTAHGFEFLNLQAGLDVMASETIGIGPFVALSLASYRKARASCDGSICELFDFQEQTVTYDDTALHQWLFFGVHGAFVF
jgi:hypothetical protein